MRQRILTIIFPLLLISANVFCAEIDQLTDREKYQGNAMDFTYILNLYTNKLITKVIKNYNLASKDNRDIKFEEIHKKIAFEIYKVTAANSNALYGSYIPNRIGILYALSKSGKGPIQNWIESETNKPYWFHLNENIYEDIYLDSLNENYIINVGGEFIGPDKIDHFFDQGYSYWVKSLYGVDDQQAVDFGMSSENGWYGLLSGGVFSFADLKANWEGYQFYKNLFSGDKPYLKLSEEGLISISSPFNWDWHIDWQYDELKNPCVISELNMKRITKYINENYYHYYNTYAYLTDQDFFSSFQKRDSYYLTDNIDLKNNHYFDLKSIFATAQRR